MNDIVKLTTAYHFAAGNHANQRRKGQLAEPYMNHLTEVAELVARSIGGADLDVVIAAVLHDTVEDTSATPEELTEAFGERVAGLVAEVTDDKTLPKGDRKRLQIEHARHASPGAKLIKLADKTSPRRGRAVRYRPRREPPGGLVGAAQGRVRGLVRSGRRWLSRGE